MMYKYFVLLVLFLFVLPQPAFAYLDPGTGSYLFQFVIAGILGGTYFMRGYIVKVKDKMMTRGSKKEGTKTIDEKPSKSSKTKK